MRRRGIESVTDRVWNFAAEVNLPRVIVINQVDHPKADSRTGRMEMLEAMRERWGRQVVPVQLPIVDQHGFHGVVDLVTMEAFSIHAGWRWTRHRGRDSAHARKRCQGRA